MTDTRHTSARQRCRAVATLTATVLALALPGTGWTQNTFGPAQRPAPAPAPAPAASPMPMPMPMPMPTPPAGPSGAQAPDGQQAEMARMEPIERKDMGVPPKATLHDGQMHGPTPNSIPGGRLITTREIYELVQRTQGDRNTAPRSFDILGGPERLPGALLAVPAGQPGSFDDATQREFGQFLQGVMQGRKDLPMIFYCASTQCWMSYNAALRAVKLGYSNVLWYRGGVEAWKYARLPFQALDGQQGQQGPGQAPAPR
jgi:PQQ-dependent catabolism-associated CXXCW motif protein